MFGETFELSDLYWPSVILYNVLLLLAIWVETNQSGRFTLGDLVVSLLLFLLSFVPGFNLGLIVIVGLTILIHSIHTNSRLVLWRKKPHPES